MALSSTILIEEVTAGPGAQPRSILLIGSGLPYMGTPWGSILSITTTWYPGNGDEADQQVIGPQELPASWAGGWHRTMLSRSPAKIKAADWSEATVATPVDLANFFETMQRAGRRLRVTWASQQTRGTDSNGDLVGVEAEVKIVRIGRCKKFEYRPSTLHDYAWAMEWEWLGRGRTTDKVTSTRAGVVTQLGAAYEAAIQAIVDAAAAAQAAKFNPSPITLGQLEALANAPSKLARSVDRSISQLQSNLGQVVGIARAVANQPTAISNMAINHARNTRAQALSIYRAFSSQGVETLSKRGDAASVLAAHKKFGDIQDKSQAGARAATSFETQIRQSTAVAQGWLAGERAKAEAPPVGSILTVHVAKDGETPQSISQRWYGTPDHAVDILKANSLSWYLAKFTKGQRLVIPVLSSATSPKSI